MFPRSVPLFEEGRIMTRAKGDASTAQASKPSGNREAAPNDQEPLNTSTCNYLQQIRQAREEVDDAFFTELDNEEQETLHWLLVKLFLSLTEWSSTKEVHLQKEEHP